MALRYRDGVTAADIAEAEAIQRKYIISNTTKNELIQAATDKSFKNTDKIR